MIEVPKTPAGSYAYRVFKYPTGAIIPTGAIFLNTQIEMQPRPGKNDLDKEKVRLVWHYFLVPSDKI